MDYAYTEGEERVKALKQKEQSAVMHIQAPALGFGAQCLMSWHMVRKRERLLGSQMH